MQVHLSSRGWSVWPEWLSLLDSMALSFPSTPAHADVFDLVSTSFRRVQMQPRKLPVLHSRCKMWCFSSWLSLNVHPELLAVASCAIPWDSQWAPWSQGRISAQKVFVLPTASIISMCWHSDQGRTCPGLHRKQTIFSGRNSPFCWHLSLRCTEELWFSGKHLGPENISLNPSMSRLAKSFSDRVSSPSSFHFPSNPVPANSSHL